ncbi:hypothetical protein [Marinisporobacter balticus]|uniref:Uncharacterized protein n=1 Tax=Marinisporobacter balticus TaxID=2018667 RepID=A0A4R2KTZ4_9FIRM|nr:hypothetical protein [Marinisporobacter balticus]TCO74569.1 hypothetical protein EV214_11247 [Marinisporobacter balticus]
MKCPECNNGKLILKDIVVYEYLYDIREDGKVKWTNNEGYTSYLFMDRKQKDFKQSVQCNHCQKIFDHIIERNPNMDMVILKKAIHANSSVSNDLLV